MESFCKPKLGFVCRQGNKNEHQCYTFWSGGAQNCITIRLDYTHDATKDRDVSRIDEIKFTFNFKYLGAIGKDDVIGLMSNTQ